MNKIKTMKTNRLSTIPTIPIKMWMAFNTMFMRSPDCSDGEDDVTSFVTSLDKDEFSIIARSRLNHLPQQQTAVNLAS